MSELEDAVREGFEELMAVGEQMTGYDAATWRSALGDRSLRSPVMAVLLLEGVPEWEQLRARFERLTRVVPVLRNRPLTGVFGLSMPRLAVDPDFDLDVHLHRMSLPEGTGWEQVLAEARRMSLTDFDLDRPLWEANLIEGLDGGRSVLLVKIHHAIADGQATVMIGANLFEFTAQGTPDEPPAPPAPSVPQIGLRDVTRANISDNLKRGLGLATSGARLLAGLAGSALRDPLGTWGDTAELASSMGRFLALPESPMSALMKGRSTTYHFQVFRIPFADMRAAAKRSGFTVNDVFLAAVSTGLAQYHERHGEPAEYLRFNIPISLRNTSKDGSAANAVTIARFPLRVSGATVEQRLQSAHEQVKRWREEPALHLANPLANASWLVPVPVIAGAARASDVTTSNVPGPPIPLYVAGVQCSGIWPLVATIGAAVNVTMVTYNGTAFIGVSTDDTAVPQPRELLDDLRAGFEQLLHTHLEPSDQLRQQEAAEPPPRAAKTTGSRPAAKRTPAKKAPAKKAPAKKVPAKKAPAKKTNPKNTPGPSDS